MMKLNAMQKKQLKAQAHKLKPIVYTGLNGLTDNVINEINRALLDHELIKVRIRDHDREVRRELFTNICNAVNAEGLQFIGAIGILYRKNPDKKPAPLPEKKHVIKKTRAQQKRVSKRT